MTGDFVRGVLADGTVGRSALQRPARSHWSAPAGTPSGRNAPARVDQLPRGDRQRARVRQRQRGLWVLGIADLRWRHILEDTDVSANHTVQPLTGSDGHVYIAASAWEDQKTRTIYDVDLAAGRATEFVRGGDVAAYDGKVAWNERLRRPGADRDRAGPDRRHDQLRPEYRRLRREGHRDHRPARRADDELRRGGWRRRVQRHRHPGRRVRPRGQPAGPDHRRRDGAGPDGRPLPHPQLLGRRAAGHLHLRPRDRAVPAGDQRR